LVFIRRRLYTTAVVPLQVRPGARYRCFGDGLCCTDIHAVGPITRAEAKRLAAIAPGLIKRNELIGGNVVTVRDGACAHLSNDGCRVHTALGLLGKPSVCRRFPYRVIATPSGKRLSTEHRCPCRTLGDRPPIDPDDALSSTRDAAGRIAADVTVGARIQITRAESITFAEYELIERDLLARIAVEDPAVVLAARPFPPLDGATWIDVAHHYRGKLDGSSCGDALAWFGDVVLSLHDTPLRRLRERKWSPAFDRAERRTTIIESPEAILADWLADEIWGLEWTERGSLAELRSDLVTRWTVAREIIRLLTREGVRADRAAAESVLIVEMAAAAPLWGSVVAAFR
jgi:hypothetical protein